MAGAGLPVTLRSCMRNDSLFFVDYISGTRHKLTGNPEMAIEKASRVTYGEQIRARMRLKA